ncbi:MAG: S41 family peptidase [Chloroflexota bacterium]
MTLDDDAGAVPKVEPQTAAEPLEATDAAPSREPSPELSKRRGGTLVVAGAIVAILAGTALFLSGWTLGRQASAQPGTPVSEQEAWQPFWDSYTAITDRYAGGEVDRQKLIQGAIKGMIASLNDPFSLYMTSDEFKASLQGISGQFSGIGTTVGTVDATGTNTTCTPLSATCRLAIESVIPGSPAEKADLRPGDIIAALDDKTVDGLTVDQATQRVRGAKDTAIKLTIARGTAPLFSVTIVRANILQPEVSTKTLAGGHVGYIKLAGFSDQSAIDFAAAVAKDVEAGQKALLIDLRANGGGFVKAADDVASQFLSSGPVFFEQDAQGTQTEVDAQPGGAATDPAIKVVILVDGGTASASEIVAAALHDRGRAQLVGTTTYGKGTIQQWTQLEGDNGGFRLTIARWLTPDKVWIHTKGIVPDVVVPTLATKPGQDPILDAGLSALGYPASP